MTKAGRLLIEGSLGHEMGEGRSKWFSAVWLCTSPFDLIRSQLGRLQKQGLDKALRYDLQKRVVSGVIISAIIAGGFVSLKLAASLSNLLRSETKLLMGRHA